LLNEHIKGLSIISSLLAKAGLVLNDNNLDFLDKYDLLKILKNMVNGGGSLSFYGKRTAEEIYKKR
jgi:hypothetical protein